MKRNALPMSPNLDALKADRDRIETERAQLVATRDRIAKILARIRDRVAYEHDPQAGKKWHRIAWLRLQDVEKDLSKLRDARTENFKEWQVERSKVAQEQKLKKAEEGRRRHEKHVRQAQTKAAQRRNQRIKK